ncbi:Hypothetical protein SRAE_1000123900 [Strongyloides ratti]|uniref:DUF7584 domain-containing protein n=1 Tax=Strongyloides ratti TaxID=34506 RepID=A0A090MVL0_STRRB|nr:Hypothetical protein SRAE_1000123900 [Strongyloides ratti]CEF62973.1 Hypothetical protein SRAE_1000123900 [Strongyloides ratti]
MIFRAVNDKPEMVIKGYNSTSLSLNNMEINAIKSDYLKKHLAIQLLLTDQSNFQDFYKDEKILINNVILKNDVVKEVPNSNKITKDSFSLNGYGLSKFSYNFGYNKKTINLNELNANGVAKHGLIRSGSYVFTSNVEEFNTSLNCTYKTPNGEATFIHSFYIRIKQVLKYMKMEKNIQM